MAGIKTRELIKELQKQDPNSQPVTSQRVPIVGVRKLGGGMLQLIPATHSHPTTTPRGGGA